jgi:hypothetical protein
MTRLSWETLPRTFESGIDRGVLFFDNNESVEWNGLVSLTEDVAAVPGNPLYFDGICYNVEQDLSDYSAKVGAYIYPYMLEDHILALCDGRTFVGDQSPSSVFGFSYRTRTGEGYRIHIVYNVVATIETTSYETISATPTLKPFTFIFRTTPVPIAGARPSSHIFVDSNEANSSKIYEIEKILYGSDEAHPRLPPVAEVVSLFNA